MDQHLDGEDLLISGCLVFPFCLGYFFWEAKSLEYIYYNTAVSVCAPYHSLSPPQPFERTSRWFQCRPAAWALSQGHKAISSGLGSARVLWVVNSWIFEKWEKTWTDRNLFRVFIGKSMTYEMFILLVPFLASQKGDTTMPAMKHKIYKSCGFMLADCHTLDSQRYILIRFAGHAKRNGAPWCSSVTIKAIGHWLHLWCCCNSAWLNLWSHDVRFPKLSHQSLITSWPTTITSIPQILIQLDSAERPWWQRRYGKPGAQGVDVLIADSLGVTRLGRASPNSPPGKVNKSSDSRNHQSLEEHQPQTLDRQSLAISLEGHLWHPRRAHGCWVEGHGCHRGQVAVPHPATWRQEVDRKTRCWNVFINF